MELKLMELWIQLMTLQRMREETDVCVVQLREEVTSLQVIWFIIQNSYFNSLIL